MRLRELIVVSSLKSQRVSLSKLRFHFEHFLLLFLQTVLKLACFICRLKDSKLKRNGSLLMIIKCFAYGAVYQTETFLGQETDDI